MSNSHTTHNINTHASLEGRLPCFLCLKVSEHSVSTLSSTQTRSLGVHCRVIPPQASSSDRPLQSQMRSILAASASVRRGPRVESLTGPGVGVSVRGWGSADRVASRKVGRKLNSSGSRLQSGVRERLWCCGPGPRLPPGLPVFLASWAGRERCTCSPVFSGPQA